MTPGELATELGLSVVRVNRILHELFPRAPGRRYERWNLSAEQVRAVRHRVSRSHFPEPAENRGESMATHDAWDWEGNVQARIVSYLAGADLIGTLEEELGRTRGSVMYAFENVSAVLEEEARPWINGYKPAHNYNRALRPIVLGFLERHPELATSVDETQTRVVTPPVGPTRTSDVVTPQPAGGRDAPRRATGLAVGDKGALRDAANRELGAAGEAWVVGLERAQLRSWGRADLADRVEWAAHTIGDGLGYDVRSFEADGTGALDRGQDHQSRSDDALLCDPARTRGIRLAWLLLPSLSRLRLLV